MKDRWVCPQCFSSERKAVVATKDKPQDNCPDHWRLEAIQVGDISGARKKVAELEEGVEYAKSMGMEFSTITESNCPEGRLQHFYREGSELYRVDEEWRNLLFEDERADREKQRAEQAEADITDIKESHLRTANDLKASRQENARLLAMLNRTENFLLGLHLDPAIPDHTRDAVFVQASNINNVTAEQALYAKEVK